MAGAIWMTQNMSQHMSLFRDCLKIKIGFIRPVIAATGQENSRLFNNYPMSARWI